MAGIMCFGESITQGYWDKELGGWVNRLRLHCDKNFEYLPVFNLGISGDTSRDILKRIQSEIEARINESEEIIIIISVGSNDSVYETKECYVSKSEYKENLKKIFTICKKFSKNIIFLGETPVDEEKTKPVEWDSKINYDNKIIEEYENIARIVADEEKVDFIEMKDVLTKKDLFDGVHPNDEGHRKIYEKIRKYLENKQLI